MMIRAKQQPMARPNFLCRPDRVSGIPIFLEILPLAPEIPRARFQENEKPSLRPMGRPHGPIKSLLGRDVNENVQRKGAGWLSGWSGRLEPGLDGMRKDRLSQKQKGHPKATQCHAWSHELDNSKKRRYFAVLHQGAVDSPGKAVMAAIMEEFDNSKAIK